MQPALALDFDGEYAFADLPDNIKERVRDRFRETQCDDSHWYEFIFEDAVTIANLMGIGIGCEDEYIGHTKATVRRHRILFSGFSSQGDGACFEGSWTPISTDISAAVRRHAPQDEKLHAIADTFAAIAKRCDRDKVYAGIRHSGHYYHEYCTDIAVVIENPEEWDEWTEFQQHVWEATQRARDFDTLETDIIEALRSYMRWIYDQLREEYFYQVSDEAIDKMIEANDYRFDEDGDLI